MAEREISVPEMKTMDSENMDSLCGESAGLKVFSYAELTVTGCFVLPRLVPSQNAPIINHGLYKPISIHKKHMFGLTEEHPIYQML